MCMSVRGLSTYARVSAYLHEIHTVQTSYYDAKTNLGTLFSALLTENNYKSIL